MQTVSTTTGRRVVDGQVEVVASEEPLEGASGFLAPALVARDAVGFEASGDHGLRLHRLLIEPGALTTPLIEAVGSDGDKMIPMRVSALQAGQPTERLQPGLGHGVIRYPLAAHEQSMRQGSVAIGQRFFVP